MVWAAEFVRAFETQSAEDAALSASSAVWALKELAGRLDDRDGHADHRAMLADMCKESP
jgi:hypothetical protein